MKNIIFVEIAYKTCMDTYLSEKALVENNCNSQI